MVGSWSGVVFVGGELTESVGPIGPSATRCESPAVRSTVYRYGERIRSFRAVFRLNGRGRKLYEGDLLTERSLRHHRQAARTRAGASFLLDSPNLDDLHRYWLVMEEGDIPRAGDHYAGVGDAVGIHGSDKLSLNRRKVDWTWGCISLENANVAELVTLVPIGTLVLIED